MGSTSPSASHDPTNDEEACIHAMELLNGFVASMTVKAAIELGLIDDLLAAGGLAVTPEELVAARPWPRPAEAAAAADRMLRFLASHGVVRCTTEWRDEECVKILKNCHRALPANGKVIVIEFVLPESPEPTPAAKGAFTLDVVMLNRLAGAKERTEREIADLAAEAG
ncbi:hypothetical protein HU200_048501 [Digitaria exilis]|uniref:O-methyltransferase C-terminal domain-containing protein n=1 Tax=Digitaria exilis TaxID=1010633 RepID=A0A835AVG9_9POAL|nr:hypothetical protein HU200_048501 [Digitaria exilis]